MNEETSYTILYQTLIQGLLKTLEQSAVRVFPGIMAITALVITSFIVLNPDSWLLMLGVGVTILLLFVLTIFILWLGVVIYFGSRNALKDVPHLTARLLVGLKSPETGRRGLTATDLVHLKKVAEVEQSAADWRGNFINLVVVGLLFGTISLLLGPVPDIVQEWRDAAQAVGETPVTVTVPSIGVAVPQWLMPLFESASYIGWSIVLIMVLLRLIRYFGDFIISEGPNRRLQLACLEAEAILAREGLLEYETLTLAKRRDLARLLGFRLKGTFIHTLKTPLYTDEAGRAWHLVPVEKPRFSLVWWFHEWSLRYFRKQRMKNRARGPGDSQSDRGAEDAYADQEE